MGNAIKVMHTPPLIKTYSSIRFIKLLSQTMKCLLKPSFLDECNEAQYNSNDKRLITLFNTSVLKITFLVSH